MALPLYYAVMLSTLISSSPACALSLPNVKSLLVARQSSSNGIYGNGNDGSGVDTNAGASGGSGSSFQLSTGGLVAIIVVVVAVVIFGVATTVLFIIAKRRQWDIRASIRRASRRITGRDRADAAADRRSKRAGVQLEKQPAMKGQGHKRGLMVEVKDVEKGQSGGRPQQSKPQKSIPQYGWQKIGGKDSKR